MRIDWMAIFSSVLIGKSHGIMDFSENQDLVHTDSISLEKCIVWCYNGAVVGVLAVRSTLFAMTVLWKENNTNIKQTLGLWGF